MSGRKKAQRSLVGVAILAILAVAIGPFLAQSGDSAGEEKIDLPLPSGDAQERSVGPRPSPDAIAGPREISSDGSSRRLRIRVVDATTRAPCPAATIHVLSSRRLSEFRKNDSESDEDVYYGDLTLASQVLGSRIGERLDCDPQGEALFTMRAVDKKLMITAACDADRSGSLYLDWSDATESELELPLFTLPVRRTAEHVIHVLDASRRPAPGVRCDVFLIDPADRAAYRDRSPSSRSAKPRFVSPICRHKSDENGEIRIRDPDALLANFDRDNRFAEADERPVALAVVPAILAPRRKAIVFPLRTKSRQHHELVLPPTGSLDLRFARPDATPVESALRISVSAADEKPHLEGRLAFDSEAYLERTKPFAVDSVRVDYVGLRHSLMVSYEFPDLELGHDVAVVGPRAVGLERRTIRLPTSMAFFRARVEAPQKVERLHIQVALDGEGAVSRALRIDPDAMVRFVVEMKSSRARMSLDAWDASDVQTSGRLPEVFVRAGALHALPAIRLHKSSARLEGSCHDDRGRPIEGAHFTVFRKASRRAGARKTYVRDLSCRTGEDGSFSCPMPQLGEDGVVVIRAEATSHALQRLEWTAGAPLHFVMPRLGMFSLRCDHLPDNARRYKITATQTRGQEIVDLKSFDARFRPRKDGILCSIGKLTPGRYHVEFSTDGLVGTHSTTVDVEPGGRSLVDLDLGVIHEFEFTLAGAGDSKSTAIESADIEVAFRKDEHAMAFMGRRATRFRDGKLRLFSLTSALNLEFLRRGKKTIRGRWTPGEHVLRFEDAARIAIQVEDPHLLLAGKAWQLVLAPRALGEGLTFPNSDRVGEEPIRARLHSRSPLEDGAARFVLESPHDAHRVLLQPAGATHYRGLELLQIDAHTPKTTYVVRLSSDRARAVQDLAERRSK